LYIVNEEVNVVSQNRLVSPGNSLVSPRRGSKQTGLSREFPGFS
jgi:hypothetical protein